jgi:hypothetical protein
MYTKKNSLFNMFVDRTAGESTLRNRLSTVETDSGNVALIGYGWLKLAEYDESRNIVTVFGGHRAIGSDTTNRHLNEVMDVARERGRDVVLSGESPTVDTPPECVKYIDHFIGDFSNDKSPVDRDAMDSVIEALS